MQAATSLLIESFDDPSLDKPITAQDLMQLYKQYASNMSSIEQCVEKGKCTILHTGEDYIRQKWYECYTCGLMDHMGCCESCMNICHKGHNVSPAKEGTFFCDCGVKDNPDCKCNK